MNLSEMAALSAVKIATILKIKRPLVFFDLETTAVDVSKARILEYCFIKVFPDGSTQTLKSLVNPECKIPPESMEIHGITDAEVEVQAPFSEHLVKIDNFLFDCDMGSFNGNHYDIPVLMYEYDRAGASFSILDIKLVDVSVMYRRLNRRTLIAAFKQYTNADLEDAHIAESDVHATMCVASKMLEIHEDLPKDVVGLDLYSKYDETSRLDLAGRFIRNEKGEVVFNFGKYKGLVARQFKEYLRDFVMVQGFSPDTKAIAQAVHNGEMK